MLLLLRPHATTTLITRTSTNEHRVEIKTPSIQGVASSFSQIFGGSCQDLKKNKGLVCTRIIVFRLFLSPLGTVEIYSMVLLKFCPITACLIFTLKSIRSCVYSIQLICDFSVGGVLLCFPRSCTVILDLSLQAYQLLH